MMTNHSQNTDLIDQLCAKSPIIPVVAIEKIEDAVPMAQALLNGGISIIEVTLRTKAALSAIALIRQELPKMTVAAGTVLNKQQYDEAVAAGAQLIISPGITDALLKHAATSNTPLLPGISSASELMHALDYGYQRFKFFPAEAAGSIAMLKALSGPFSDVKFCPTGGISTQNAKQFLALPNVMCVGGSWLTPASLVSSQCWNEISTITQQSLANCH